MFFFIMALTRLTLFPYPTLFRSHTPSGRTLGYGALAEKAAKLPVPEKVALKDPKDFTLIGTPAKRLDAPDKVNGDRKSTRLNSSHTVISYAVFCLKKKIRLSYRM